MRRVAGLVLLAALVGCSANVGTSASSRPSRSSAITLVAVEPTSAVTQPATSAPTSTSLPASALAESGRTESISLYVDGAVRSALVRRPATPSSAKAPLVLALHGSDGSAADLERITGYDEVADREGFFVVYADGLPIDIGAGFVSRSWNSGECCEPATSAQVDDVSFLATLLDMVLRRYPVDASRIFVVGHSNGAIMAQLVACRLADRLAGIASVAGSLDDTITCNPSRPLPFLEIHGTADQNVLWEFGQRSVVEWRAFDRCPDQSDLVVHGDVTTTTWSACANDTVVQFASIEGADHPWPSQRTPTFDGLEISSALDATEATWSFFSSVSPRRTASRPG